MIKHRLMLSAAAAVLLAVPSVAALADVTVSTAQTDQMTTEKSGNITVDSNGSFGLKSNGAVLVLNSNNFINNSGLVSNINTTGSIGILIDTTTQDIVAPSPGLLSSNTITVTGEGTNKTGVLILGGHTYFGDIALNNTTAVNLNGQGATILVSGDNASAFTLAAGTQVVGEVSIGGSISSTPDPKTTSSAGSSLFLFSGNTYGNVFFDGSVAASNAGQNSRGISIYGEINACSAATLASGYTCVSGNGRGQGALINAGRIVTVGQVIINPKSKDPILEGGSVLEIGNSIAGGFYNVGPATANGGLTAAVLSGAGVDGNAVLRIDPYLAQTTAGLRGPIKIGPLSADIDAVDPDYSILNRGTIVSQPTAFQRDTNAVFIQGASSTFYTCLGTGDFGTCGSDGKGGFLNTGTINALATTNVTTLMETTVNATAMVVGPYAAIPRLVVRAETTGVGARTPGLINANVNGTSGGSATAVMITENAKVPLISVGIGASIQASVTTTTTAPTLAQGNSTSPFVMTAQAIVDSSGSLTTINNAGTIQAKVTTVNPGVDAVVVSTIRAINLLASNANGVVINNSGRILGDILYGSGGSGYVLNVGNTGGGGAGNPATNTPELGGLNNPNNYAIIASSVVSENTSAPPITLANLVDFGGGTGHTLRVGAFGYVNSVFNSSAGGVAVTVENQGTLFVANTTKPFEVSTFDVTGGTLGLTISQATTASSPVIRGTGDASINSNSKIALQFGSFISSGTTRQSVDNPTAQEIVLISAPHVNIDPTTLAQNNLYLSENLPFLFQADATPLKKSSAAGNETLVLSLTPRTPGAGTAANPGLGLSGDALAQFPYIASALATDSALGSAIATSLTVYNTPGQSSSKINVAASQQAAQQAFSQFGPDTSGGARQVAIMITDQATGPVAARQRLLRAYSSVPGELTLWGQEFFGNINNKGRVSADGSLTNYKDHGFGFTLGLDGGSPRGGWYGGAFTFYSGDVVQTLPRNTKTQTNWYMLTGYSQWKGRRLFVDTQASFAYGDFVGQRDLVVGGTGRRAEGKRAALMLALGGKMGAALRGGGFDIAPHISLDGLAMREEGYTETGGGSGFNLQVAPSYANSLRTALGVDLKTSVPLFGFRLSPEARVGYRYDLINMPVKLRAGFVSTGGTATAGNVYKFVGPDPDTGNVFGGLSLSAGTDSWHVGVNFDMVRGNNGSTTQVGTVTLLGRI